MPHYGKHVLVKPMGKEIHHDSQIPREDKTAGFAILKNNRGTLANTADERSSCVFIRRVKP
jgi:hypothetical protein